MQSDIGVPHKSLLEIRAFKAPHESLYSFMRSLPPEQVSWLGGSSKPCCTAGPVDLAGAAWERHGSSASGERQAAGCLQLTGGSRAV